MGSIIYYELQYRPIIMILTFNLSRETRFSEIGKLQFFSRKSKYYSFNKEDVFRINGHSCLGIEVANHKCRYILIQGGCVYLMQKLCCESYITNNSY